MAIADDSLKFRVETWAILMLEELTEITELAIVRKVESGAADNSCIMVEVMLGKKTIEGDGHYNGKLTVELRCLQTVSADDYEAFWGQIAYALETITSVDGDDYAAVEIPNGLQADPEEAEDDKEEESDNFHHRSRTVPIKVCP